MDEHEWLCPVKTARQKKRLVKTDHDKQLIQLAKRKDELWLKRRNLPLVPLEHPYQRGWKRFFVLRDDVKRSPMAKFYGNLLVKINTYQYNADRSFKQKKRKRKRYGYVVKQQSLREFNTYDWDANRVNLTEDEKCCFTRTEAVSHKTRRTEVKYVFAEPWRYTLKIAPHMVTHKKPVDTELEQEIARIENRIERDCLRPRMDRLMRGHSYSWNKMYKEREKYFNIFKNLPRNAGKEAYLELEY